MIEMDMPLRVILRRGAGLEGEIPSSLFSKFSCRSLLRMPGTTPIGVLWAYQVDRTRQQGPPSNFCHEKGSAILSLVHVEVELSALVHLIERMTLHASNKTKGEIQLQARRLRDMFDQHRREKRQGLPREGASISPHREDQGVSWTELSTSWLSQASIGAGYIRTSIGDFDLFGVLKRAPSTSWKRGSACC